MTFITIVDHTQQVRNDIVNGVAMTVSHLAK